MVDKIKKFLFHPKHARILYDFIFSLLTTLIIYIFLSTNLIVTNSPALFSVPFVYTMVLYFYGIYGNLRYITLLKKVLVISYAGFTSLAILYLLKADMSLSATIIIFSVILSSIARWMTNLPHQSIRRDLINPIIHANQPVLVVGGAGYIGSHTVKKLLEKGERVRIFDKFVYGEQSIKEFAKNKNLEIIRGDISDLYTLTLAVNNVKAVIHLAGIVGDPAAKLDSTLTRHINIVTTRMLKETVKAFKIPKFIFASSCSVYGATEKIVDETSQLNPVSLYAQSKIDSEKDLLEDPYDEFNPTILRFATVFGHSSRMRFDLVLNLFCAQAYYGGQISIFGGENYRPFVHVSDIGSAVVKVLDSPIEIVSRNIFNVGDNSMNTSIIDLANKVSQIIKKDRYGNRVKLHVNDSVTDRRNYNVSFDKIHTKLGFSSQINFDQGIQEIYHNMKKKAYKYKYTDQLYSNFETTKIMKKEFHSKAFQETHYSTIMPFTNKVLKLERNQTSKKTTHHREIRSKLNYNPA